MTTYSRRGVAATYATRRCPSTSYVGVVYTLIAEQEVLVEPLLAGDGGAGVVSVLTRRNHGARLAVDVVERHHLVGRPGVMRGEVAAHLRLVPGERVGVRDIARHRAALARPAVEFGAAQLGDRGIVRLGVRFEVIGRLRVRDRADGADGGKYEQNDDQELREITPGDDVRARPAEEDVRKE